MQDQAPTTTPDLTSLNSQDWSRISVNPNLTRDIMTKFTRKQSEAIKRLYDRSQDGAASYLSFRRRFQVCFGDYVGTKWCGMFIGIETDGYTHS